MNHRLLTYQECKEIASKNENFYEKVLEIQGFKISIFNYIVSIYEHFKNPIKTDNLTAYEMRGLTFIHQDNDHKRYLMLHKFFNLNENEDYQLEDLKKHRIVSIQEKLDGSMIRAIKLPNNSIICKTKSGFDNPQSNLANQLLNKNKNLLDFTKECLDNHLAPIYELCSPLNKIVVDYNESKLILIQLRDESTGSYLDIYNNPLVAKYSIEKTKNCPIVDFETLLEQQKNETHKEGYVVSLENGIKFKIKNQWYLERHRLLDNIAYENKIIELICNETLDDAIALLDKNNEARIYSENIQKFILNKISETFHSCLDLLEKSKNISRKEFALTYGKDKNFPITSRFINKLDFKDELIKSIKDKIVFDTRRLEMARSYLKNNGFHLLEMKTISDE